VTAPDRPRRADLAAPGRLTRPGAAHPRPAAAPVEQLDAADVAARQDLVRLDLDALGDTPVRREVVTELRARVTRTDRRRRRGEGPGVRRKGRHHG
jgi:hypothetical protein